MSDEDLSALHPTSLFDVKPPVLVRKLNRLAHWKGREGQSIEERAEYCYEESFREDSDGISLFRIEDGEDFASVIVGINGTPGRGIDERSHFAVFQECEFAEYKLTLSEEAGDTNCHHANQLHRNLKGERTSVLRLIQKCMENQLKPKRPSKASMRTAITHMESKGCDVLTPPDTLCECKLCVGAAHKLARILRRCWISSWSSASSVWASFWRLFKV